jgi:hypothetical protein
MKKIIFFALVGLIFSGCCVKPCGWGWGCGCNGYCSVEKKNKKA